MAGVAVERVRAAEWRELRELRLRALADAPEAFASTLAREAAFPDDVWRQRAQGGLGPPAETASEEEDSGAGRP